jgi:hypothetical protein
MPTACLHALRHALFFTLATTFASLAVAAVATPLAPAKSPLRPDSMFLQAGDGNHTQTATIGFSWDLPWHTQWANGELSAYVDASLGRWWINQNDIKRSPWVTQLGMTPVLRYRWGQERPRWFAELGIGMNVLAPILDNQDRRFSTAFNFGDHLALGRSFGANDENEIALRVQHYSNGGIKQPNPGINFVQLRYAHRF